MAEIKFSEKQTAVIESRNKNLLVSAAAGSGKTAVLVQRIITKVVKDNIDIDKILVLTYTEAAAGEMRSRIEKAIIEEAQKNPLNKNIARQAILIHNAQISTIHGFCLSLIRNNFAQIDLDPSFRVAETGEIKLVEEQVADKLIEDIFEENLIDDIELLANRFTKHNSMEGLKEILLKTYSVCRNTPFIKDYIAERCHDYECANDEGIFTTKWGKALKEYADNMIKEAVCITKDNLEKANCAGGAYVYKENLESDLERLQKLPKDGSYNDYYLGLKSVDFVRLSTKKAEDIDIEVRNHAKEQRNEVKAIITGLADDLFFMPPEMLLKGMAENNRVINALMQVVLMYHDRLEMEKQERKIIDFSDMEHYALRILLKKEGEEYVPTQVAKDYRESFDEIMVDEYQDSNYIQESILQAISGEEDGRFNRFMVGDVKQSIYSFRNACPEIFMQKFNDYSYEDDGHRRIDLSTNYRSRAQVLDSVNYVFERLMGEDLGKVEYSDEVRLNLGSNYIECGDSNKTELIVLDYDSDTEEKKQEQEARLVAQRIMRLKKEHFQIQDEDKLRDVDYKDMVILLRTNKGWDEIFKRVLEQYGIPAYVASKTGYFSAKEIRNLLNLLQVFDNPRSEIELFGALTGWFGKFEEEEIAIIRGLSKCELYDAISQISDGTFEYLDKISSDIQRKSTDFMAFLKKYREKILYTPINELLEEIINEYEYMYYVGALPFGEQRRANVYMLIEKAKQYESGSFKGLYHFIRYINEIQSYEIDYGEASILDEQSNVVRIMSIHKSKGLEFPVCFISGMGKSFNYMDANAAVVFDKDYGIGLDYIRQDKNIKYKDLRHKFLAKCMREDVIAEEMRVLYVAMTRAKEKLIMTSCMKEAAATVQKYCEGRSEDKISKLIPYLTRSKCSSYMDFMLNTIKLDDDKIKVLFETLEDLDRDLVYDGVERAKRKEEIIDLISSTDEGLNDGCDDAINKIMFKYSHDDLKDLYTKTSVSELKMAVIHDAYINKEMEDVSDEFFATHENESYVPRFAREEEKVKGTARGSAYHRVMELFPFENTEFFEGLDQGSQRKYVIDVIEKMISDGRIDTEVAELVDINRIITFLESELADRMCKAARRGELYLEEPFVLGISAERLKESYPKEETVLIQGIIDVFFVEDDKIVLMDYKTDKVSSEDELVKRYKVQLDYYKEALERILEKEVSEQIIYSFSFGKEIKIV